MRLSTKISGIVAIGGVAALGAGLISSGGIGAAFTDNATAKAAIDVGTFQCNLSQTGTDWTIATHSDNTQTATIKFDTIESSAAGSKTAPLILTNDGSMNAFATWTVSALDGNLPSEFSAAPAPANAVLAPTNTQVANLGFEWKDLGNSALGKHGSLTYTVHCSEAPSFLVNNWLYADGAAGESSASWTGESVALSVTGNTKADAYKYGPSAGINLLDVSAGSSVPPSAPNYTRAETQWNSGGPRLDIELSNGQYIRGYSWSATSPLGWDYPGSTTGNATWDKVLEYVSTAGNPTVTSARITLDTGGTIPYTGHVTCVNYTGTALFGTC